ncbi:MAG: type I restriction enzyme HsdR N-terminal domain-containing protein [Treponema sp.]|jgi:hypothetical protein|nr:type I restriction enzyme HsdR N-terminal domain-containing protein [Treponema sp.]
MQINELRRQWDANREAYKSKEIGSGVHSFVKEILKSSEILNLSEFASKKEAIHVNFSFIHDTEATKNGRPDFVLFIDNNVIIPVECKCYTKIEEGINQLLRYQIDYNKHYGILTDGYSWRFYRSSKYTIFTIDEIFNNIEDFKIYWKEYIKSENFYKELFNNNYELFNTKIILNDNNNRPIFFDDITNLIRIFKVKMKKIGAFDDLFNQEENEKIALETSYAYLIQFILFKVLVDNNFKKINQDYEKILIRIKKAIQDSDLYSIITNEIKNISEYISKNIYKPFKYEQEIISKKLIDTLQKTPDIEDIAPWLDIITFIDKYDFSNIKNEIFGFIYENYLKDLYGDEKKGQYFTDPAVVNLMLKELGYTSDNIRPLDKNDLSIIDPSCGAGTFLYSAVNEIINAFDNNTFENARIIEKLIDFNIFGLDIEEFPLFLTEMNIIMRMLPIIVNDNFENPVYDKLKIFKTNDSIAEFSDVGISTDESNLFSHLKGNALDYPSFMRSEKDLNDMLISMQDHMGIRQRFDYVIGNPPYISYLECSKKNLKSFSLMKDMNNKLKLNNIYSVNLHSVPNNRKKYSPRPNLFSFFIALGFALLKDNGKICYIIPQTVLVNSDLDVIRYYLANNTTIEKIITFNVKLFVGRGLKQNKPVYTSSLIFIARKNKPNINHIIELKNYISIEQEITDLEYYFNNTKIFTSTIRQTDLLNDLHSWNYLLSDKIFIFFKDIYNKNSDISKYYEHSLAQLNFNAQFYFDGSINILKKNITDNPINSNDYKIPHLKHGNIFASILGYYRSDIKIKEAQGSQGLIIAKPKYKILWKYINFDGFYFSDIDNLLPMYQQYCIASDNKDEILYLYSILTSKINIVYLNKMLRVENEDKLTFILGLTPLKKLIKIPVINDKTMMIKKKIIYLTNEYINNNKIKLGDLIDFSKIKIQKFDKLLLKKDKLTIQFDKRLMELPFDKNNYEIIKNVIQIINKEEPHSISILKNFLVKKDLTNIFNEINDYIFIMYFNLSISNVDNMNDIKIVINKNKYYKYINNEYHNILN